MNRLSCLAISVLFCVPASAVIVYEQPFSNTGGLVPSSWLDPNGSDADMYAYDSFMVSNNVPVTEVHWRGGYSYGAPYGHVTHFTITFFESIAGGSQPHLTNPQLPEIYLARYNVGDNAGETSAGIFGGMALYDYSYVLPTPFQAIAGNKYWIRIEAAQIGYPDWGVAVGTGGDGHHFAFSTGAARFFVMTGDEAFALIAPPGPYYTITTQATPPQYGSTSGDGVFTDGSTATVVATANPGYAFVNWTQNGTQVSTAASYPFTVNANRTLVANFAPAFTINTSAAPAAAGSTDGGGSYTYGKSVTVSATANANYVFVNWTENGLPVCAARNYTFNAGEDRTLVANFVAANTNLTTLVSQPHNGSGTVIKSAWYYPGEQGLDGDAYIFDDFLLATSQSITEVHWRGGYTNYLSGAGKSPVADFTVAIYASIAVGTEPSLGAAPLVKYSTLGNANETPAGTFGGVEMYDYSFVLPSAFHANANTRYWLQIEASQSVTPFYYWPPDWGFGEGSGGNQHLFQIITGGPSFGLSKDIAFTLLGAVTGNSIATIASPPEGGLVDGAGVYGNGASVTVTATANPGYTFINWNQNGVAVSTNASYQFTASTSRTLVANFAPAYTITTLATPDSSGTTSGDGAYFAGANVALVATPKPGYALDGWYENDVFVSGQTTYYFIANGDRSFQASFVPIYTVTATAAPVGSGFTTGSGVYHHGDPVDLVPTPNAGFAFSNWTENGTIVCNTSKYNFLILANRNLVANFSPACAIGTSVSSAVMGSTTGDGTYAGGAIVGVMATPRTGYAFTNWTENGLPVSSSAWYTFTATTGRSLLANFRPDPATVTFDLDTGVPALTLQQTTPIDQTSGGLTAHFSSPLGTAFAIQSDTFLGWNITQFSGHYFYPSMEGGTLEVNFDHPLRSITLTFATLDYQDVVTPSDLQVTAYNGPTSTSPLGSTSATGIFHTCDTMPMGVITFNSPTPFDTVKVELMITPTSAVNFMADSFTVIRTVPGDFDNNGRVDHLDTTAFVACALGPAIPARPGCENRDFDADGDVDQVDFGVFQKCFSGPDQQGDPACAG